MNDHVLEEELTGLVLAVAGVRGLFAARPVGNVALTLITAGRARTAPRVRVAHSRGATTVSVRLAVDATVPSGRVVGEIRAAVDAVGLGDALLEIEIAQLS